MSIVPPNPFEPISEEMWAELLRLYPDDYMREVTKAMTIATDLEACKALLRGESVPPERIDWDQARRYGRRHERPTPPQPGRSRRLAKRTYQPPALPATGSVPASPAGRVGGREHPGRW
jgi:hypothetical protein